MDETMSIIIRDLSVYDPLPVAYGSYDGFVIRCFNGSIKDARFDLHKAGAVIADKIWWAYAFYNFLYPAEPQAQAVINILDEEPGALPVAFDVEEWGGHQYPGRDILLNGLFTLYDKYGTATNKICQFYMNPATIHYLKPIPSWLLACPLWLAHWGISQPDYEPWAKWTFWQYAGEPDLNRFNGTDSEYRDYVNGDEAPEPLRVRVNVANLTIRSAPLVQANTVLGYTSYGKVWTVESVEQDTLGRNWYKVGASVYIAGWLCVPV